MAILTPISRKPLQFVLPILAAVGAILGLLVGTSNGNSLGGLVIGALGFTGLSLAAIKLPIAEKAARWIIVFVFAIGGYMLANLALGLLGLMVGAFTGWFVYWLYEGRYRAKLLPYLTPSQVLWHYTFRMICGAIFFFLISPIIVVMPLSFNAQDFFTFTEKMLALDPEGYSLKHYADFLGIRYDSNGEWIRSFWNSLIIAPLATMISVSLGTLAAIGLSQSHVPAKRAIMAILISPMIVPLIISATGMFFFYAKMGNFLEGTVGLDKDFVGYIKVVLAHAVLGIPFVIITVTATLVGFDRSLTRAAASMGAGPVTTFFRIQMPLILPGVISGGLFAFITSFDEVVVVMFIGSASQKTLPWQMFLGLREQISPTILAVATILVALSIALLATLEILRRHSERLRGMTPT
ncbi:MAG: polyamine ABC transporter permease [SAR116 cluster bacterium MED-G04]|jgi:putative spermidine/putrescine transport system permease protein|nr:MAG: polyamine ABC transporter permease [SAR116 cluster bacterium MED-G04]HCD49207.1 polyamine ABC transporter permease [Alphaproteobacteria bacterium]HCV61739.1 polyamine ABC transporter permease [Alphaproteobacteria bacterium]|tara:strand:+ start:6569 stop:7795 length:1227 start_codon:yes stop_codon:yes gene_type:complete